MKKAAGIALALGGCVVLAALPYGLAQRRRAAENQRRTSALSHIYPDQQTRQLTEGVKTDEVAYLRLYGIHMGCFNGGSTPPITVRNAGVIGSFVQGLQRATRAGNIGIGNGVDNLELHFKTLKGHTREPLYFDFNPTTPNLWYGDGFAQALRRLGRFQAGQIRAKTASLGPEQVAWLRVGETTLTDPAQVAPVWRALQSVDGRAYAYEDRRSAKWFGPLQARLKNGTTLSFNFVLSSQMPDAQLQPLWDFRGVKAA